jgi:hypothetical protein
MTWLLEEAQEFSSKLAKEVLVPRWGSSTLAGRPLSDSPRLFAGVAAEGSSRDDGVPR